MRLICPRCRRTLARIGDALVCGPCQTDYPIVSGIPDVRIAPDPWIGMTDDRAKGTAIDAEAPEGLEPAVRAYWARTPTTSAIDATRHIDHVLRAIHRTREWVAGVTPAPVAGERWLDLGCGTADLACAVPISVHVTGLDVAFRWLIVARRRLREMGRDVELYCGNAEALPFPDATFDRVVALGTLEHCADLAPVLREARRVLRPEGYLHVRTANRWSLLPEPHVGLMGVGWLPRPLADRYVRMRGGRGYRHHRLPGPGELRRALRLAGFTNISVRAAEMLPAEAERMPRLLRKALPIYDHLRGWPATRHWCRAFAPLLDATARSSASRL